MKREQKKHQAMGGAFRFPGSDAGVPPACDEGILPSCPASVWTRLLRIPPDADRMSATRAGETPASHAGKMPMGLPPRRAAVLSGFGKPS